MVQVHPFLVLATGFCLTAVDHIASFVSQKFIGAVKPTVYNHTVFYLPETGSFNCTCPEIHLPEQPANQFCFSWDLSWTFVLGIGNASGGLLCWLSSHFCYGASAYRGNSAGRASTGRLAGRVDSRSQPDQQVPGYRLGLLAQH